MEKVEVVSPSKWDVIPIHASDRASFKACRRQWAWSSPSRLNLTPKAGVHGVRIPFWFGTGIHHALQHFYNPALMEDPVVVFETWFNLQWNGGLVSDEEVAEFVDREPQEVGHPTIPPSNYGDGSPDWDEDTSVTLYRVKGLAELLPFADTEEEKFMELLDLGKGMLQFYKKYAAREDNFRVVALEHNFSVPVLNPTTGEALYMEDVREMPESWEPNYSLENEYGSLMMYGVHQTVKQVHARGRMDMIVQDNDNGQYLLLDHKTTSRLDDDYFRHLELDEQCTTYLTCGEIEARLYDLEYKELSGIVYEAILKGYPKPPTITSRGIPSIDRQNETTTAELFEKAIKELGLKLVFDADVKLQNYYTWLLEQGDKRFIHREPVNRNKHQKANAMARLYYEAIDMLSDPKLYPNPRKEYGCLNCVFRSPCIAAEDGSDYKAMLEDGYVPNWDR